MSRTLPLPDRTLSGRLSGDQYCGQCAACVMSTLRYFGRWPPRWRISVGILGIVRRKSIQTQPLCLPEYRRAPAVQLFGNLRSRICRPQGNKFAEFLVGPTGHGGTSVMAAPAPGAMPTDSCGIILAIALSPRRRLRAAREPTRTGQLINASYRVPRFGPVGAGADTAGGEIC